MFLQFIVIFLFENFRLTKAHYLKNNTMEILFVASKLSDVNAFSSIVKKAGLNPVIMDVRCFTLKNAFDNIKFHTDNLEIQSAILELGHEENYLIIIHKNIPIRNITTHIRFSFFKKIISIHYTI